MYIEFQLFMYDIALLRWKHTHSPVQILPTTRVFSLKRNFHSTFYIMINEPFLTPKAPGLKQSLMSTKMADVLGGVNITSSTLLVQLQRHWPYCVTSSIHFLMTYAILVCSCIYAGQVLKDVLPKLST